VGRRFPIGILGAALAAAVGALPLVCVEAAGLERFVSPTGTDHGDCTVENDPCASIQYAVDQSASGDRVLIAPGHYVGAVTVPNTLTSLFLVGGWRGASRSTSRSVTPEATVIDGEGAGHVLTIESCVASMELHVARLTISNGEVGILASSECWPSPASGPITVRIDSCVISDNECGVILKTVESHPGPVAGEVINTVVRDNAPWSGIAAHSDPNTRVDLLLHSSTVMGNDHQYGGGLLLSAWGASSGPSDLNATVVNSIIWGNTQNDVTLTGRPHPFTVLSLDAMHSDFGSVLVEWGSYNPQQIISLDPLFASADDYHLIHLSPCVDAGTADGAPPFDIDGDTRPLRAGYDMGADEHDFLIFADGLESGDATRWAACVGCRG
jgi:hypothetical protein